MHARLQNQWSLSKLAQTARWFPKLHLSYNFQQNYHVYLSTFHIFIKLTFKLLNPQFLQILLIFSTSSMTMEGLLVISLYYGHLFDHSWKSNPFPNNFFSDYFQPLQSSAKFSVNYGCWKNHVTAHTLHLADFHWEQTFKEAIKNDPVIERPSEYHDWCRLIVDNFLYYIFIYNSDRVMLFLGQLLLVVLSQLVSGSKAYVLWTFFIQICSVL